jgi:hypothetical protein
MSTDVSLVAGLVVERVGDDLMVIVPGNSDVVSLSGRPAEVLSDVEAGRQVDSTNPALLDLVDLGIVSAPGLSRRGLIKAGAVGVGVGVASLALPTAAFASSANRDSITGIYSMAGEGNPWGFLVLKDDVSAGTPETLTLTVGGTAFQSSALTGSGSAVWTTTSSAAVSFNDIYWLHGVTVSGALLAAVFADSPEDVSGSFSSGGTTYDVTYSFIGT